jgi:hypothetical protein
MLAVGQTTGLPSLSTRFGSGLITAPVGSIAYVFWYHGLLPSAGWVDRYCHSWVNAGCLTTSCWPIR